MHPSEWLIERLAAAKLAELRSDVRISRLVPAWGWRTRLATRLRTLADRLEPARQASSSCAALPS